MMRVNDLALAHTHTHTHTHTHSSHTHTQTRKLTYSLKIKFPSFMHILFMLRKDLLNKPAVKLTHSYNTYTHTHAKYHS